jgi:hypothetical protein
VDQLARQHQSVQLATKCGKAGCLDPQLVGSAPAAFPHLVPADRFVATDAFVASMPLNDPTWRFPGRMGSIRRAWLIWEANGRVHFIFLAFLSEGFVFPRQLTSNREYYFQS